MVRVAELMQTDVQTIHIDSTVAEAIMLLTDGHVSGMPVLNDAGSLVGVVSSTDILTAEAESDEGEALDRVASYARVGDIMTRVPKTIEPDADIRLAAQEMLYLDVHRLLVVDNESLVGIVSQSDIVRAVAGGKI